MQVGNEGEGNIDALYGFGDLDELVKKNRKNISETISIASPLAMKWKLNILRLMQLSWKLSVHKSEYIAEDSDEILNFRFCL
jgi:hypothetical protein